MLVRDGQLAGEGFHDYDKKDHAEVAALKDAGENTRGATAYVTLEPCCYTGRTGPCTEALIRAGVRRVVAATADPNPLVQGEGFARLRGAGIAVEVGEGMARAREMNDGFARLIRTGLPFVTLKTALSMDGRIAPEPGTVPARRPFYLTGERALEAVQQMRHTNDAVLTGIGTVLADDPLLTDRTGLGRRRPLLRVVLDSSLRIPLDSKIVRGARHDVIVFCTHCNTSKRKALEAMGVKVESVEGEPGEPLSVPQVLQRLGEMQILSVMVEAGSLLSTSVLVAGAADKLVLFYAPLLLGDTGVPWIGDRERKRLQFERAEWSQLGADARFRGYLRDPWK